MLGTERPAKSRAGFEMLMINNSRSLPSTARILAALFAGSPSQVSSCALATAELITRTVRAPPDLPSADCSSTATKSKTGNFSLRLAKCQLPASRLQIRREARRDAPDQQNRRLVRSAAAIEDADSRNPRAPRSARDGKLL